MKYKFDNLANRAEREAIFLSSTDDIEIHKLTVPSLIKKKEKKNYQPFLYFYRLNGQCTMTQTPNMSSIRTLNARSTQTQKHFASQKYTLAVEEKYDIYFKMIAQVCVGAHVPKIAQKCEGITP